MHPQVLSLARLIDHAVLHPIHTAEDTRRECELALRWHTGAACVKSCFVAEAAEILSGSTTAVCAVTGFPHGNTSAAVKAYETAEAVAAGATEIDTVVNNGLVFAREWSAVEAELRAVRQACPSPLVVKVILETDYLEEEHIIGICQAATAAGLDFVKTSTGFGYVKGSSGGFHTVGATPAAIALMRASSGPHMQLKASGGIRTLADLERFRDLGCTRMGASATESILQEAVARYGGEQPAPSGRHTEGY